MKLKLLQNLQEEYRNCNKCELSKNRKQIVFGKGNINAKLLFLGEASGKNEDEKGIPFCGQAGKMLDKMIEAMGMTTDEVYICNAALCRPPNNRKPSPAELSACAPRLEAQLKLVNPKIIVALGASAADALLGSSTLSLSKRRAGTFQWHNIPVKITYHPAALLYNPSLKNLAAEDLKEVLNFMKKEK